MRKPDFDGSLQRSVRLRVPFFDIDPAGVVWHGRYFQYFELARRELLESVGYSYEEMETSGIFWVVTDTNVRYLRPLFLNQEIIVTACLQEWEMRIVVDYQIADEAGTVFTRGRTVQAPVDSKSYELILGAPQFFIDNVAARLREEGPAPE
jgi:acyl-CoA thioester hydrolase